MQVIRQDEGGGGMNDDAATTSTGKRKRKPTRKAGPLPIPSGMPVFRCTVTKGGLWTFWCPHCRVQHTHGAGDGHRVAHCADDGPYAHSGYHLIGPSDVVDGLGDVLFREEWGIPLDADLDNWIEADAKAVAKLREVAA